MHRTQRLAFIAISYFLCGLGLCQSTGSNQNKIDERALQSEKRMKDMEQKRAMLIGKTAPNPMLNDFQEKALLWENYKGKLVLIDFWATSCPPCVASIPELVKSYKLFKKNNIEFISICMDLEGNELNQYTQKKQMDWPQFGTKALWHSHLVELFGISYLPQYFLLNEEGEFLEFLDSYPVYDELCRHLVTRAKDKVKSMGDEFKIFPEDVFDLKIKEKGERCLLSIVFAPKILMELDAWAAENKGKKARITADGITVFFGKMPPQMSSPNFVYAFNSKEDAKAIYDFLIGQ